MSDSEDEIGRGNVHTHNNGDVYLQDSDEEESILQQQQRQKLSTPKSLKQMRKGYVLPTKKFKLIKHFSDSDDPSSDDFNKKPKATPNQSVISKSAMKRKNRTILTEPLLLAKSSVDENDDGPTEAVQKPLPLIKRSYTCRMCGVPRKGHVCPQTSTAPPRQGKQHNQRQAVVAPSQSPSLSKMQHSRKKRRHNSKKIGKTESARKNKVFNNCDNGSSDYDDDDDDSSFYGEVPYTEVLVPAHIFMDEVHIHLQRQQQDKRFFSLEKEYFQKWATNVHDEFQKLNAKTYKEIRHYEKQKLLQQRIEKERDSIVTLKSKIRAIHNENRKIEGRITLLRNEHNTNISASRFLAAIDSLR